jgi:YVTN family beta-propeller protein
MARFGSPRVISTEGRILQEASMRKRATTTVWISALIAGWLFWLGPGAAVAAPKAYVGLFKDDAVAVIDTAQNKVIATISVPKGPHGLVITPDGRKVYVSSDGASTVSVIDTASDRVIATIEVGVTRTASPSRGTGGGSSRWAGARTGCWSSTPRPIA